MVLLQSFIFIVLYMMVQSRRNKFVRNLPYQNSMTMWLALDQYNMTTKAEKVGTQDASFLMKANSNIVSYTLTEPFMNYEEPLNGNMLIYSQTPSLYVRHLQKRSIRETSDLRYQGCKKDHDPRVRIGLTNGDRFLCWYSKFCPCNLDDEPETEVWAADGILHVTSPCCLNHCSINFRIQAPLGQELLLEFLDMRISTVKGQNSDATHLCFDSYIFFLNFWFRFCGDSPPPPIRVMSRRVDFMLALYDNSLCPPDNKVMFKLRYRACSSMNVTSDICPQQLVYTTPGWSGYVKSPGFDWLGSYPPNTFCRWNISVEIGNVIRLHFAWFRLPNEPDPDVLKIYINDYSTADPSAPASLIYRYRVLQNVQAYTIVLPGNTATMEFTSDDEDSSKGFNIIFDAVDPRLFVPIIDETTLNCSGINTSSLPEHIRCNFRQDCLDGEDEIDCPYNSTSCPHGGYLLNHKCVYIHAPDYPISWEQAAALCWDKYGGHLFTPRNVAETSFLKALTAKDFRVFLTPMFFGLRGYNGKITNSESQTKSLYSSQTGHGSNQRNNGAASLLYRRMQVGSDGTTVFEFLGYYQSAEVSSCVIWTTSQSNSGYYLWRVPCDKPHVPNRLTGHPQNVYAVCEVKKPNLQQKPEPILPLNLGVSEPLRNLWNYDQHSGANETSFTGSRGESSNSSEWVGVLETFHCLSSRENISLSRRCDRVPDCFDGTDETNCEDFFASSLISARFQCPAGLLVSYIHVCDGVNDCLDGKDESFCHPEQEEPGITRVCSNGLAMPVAVWCDAKPDCLDGSDEVGCQECSPGSVLCPGIGCYPDHWVDDKELDCSIQGKDGHWAIEPNFSPRFTDGIVPPAVVLPDGYGKAKLVPLSAQGDKDMASLCPSTHAQCHGQGFCIPEFMLCNGVKDCPDGEDELLTTCQLFCRDRFRCHSSSICLHESHVCDGWPHCPLHDDEIMCPSRHAQQTTCPDGCRCLAGQLVEMICDVTRFIDSPTEQSADNGNSTRNTKYLRLTSSKSSSLEFKLYIMAPRLVNLEITFTSIQHIYVLSCPQLYEFDGKGNQLMSVPSETFSNTTEIRLLDLSENKIQNINFEFLKHLRHLEFLDLSYNNLTSIQEFSFSRCPKLKRIVLKSMGIRDINNNAFSGLVSLQHLELVGNTISKFGASILTGLSQLKSLHADNYRLCCSQVVPESLKTGICQVPTDEISSCKDILATEFFRGFLWAVAILTITGNGGVLVYRLVIEKRKSANSGSGGRQRQQLGYGTFITSLAASDFLMGVYLCLIGGADFHYRGRYLWAFSEWTRSALCSMAGFLCFVSSEVSELTIALVTLDRLLALAFPLSENLHFSPFSARIASLAAWTIGVILAAVPLFPQLDTLWDRFYSQNGVCIPLPITRAQFPGKEYSFTIFVVFNMTIFLLIALGQILVFWAVRSNSMNSQKISSKPTNDDGNAAEIDKQAKKDAHRSRQHQQEAAIARKLALVVASDFLCWVPIGVLGLMSRLDVPVPGQASVVASVFLLPLNAALNPFLYTLSAIFVNRKTRKRKNSAAVNVSHGRKGATNRVTGTSSVSGSRSASSSHNRRNDGLSDAREPIEEGGRVEQSSGPVRENREQLRQLKTWIILAKTSPEEVHRCLQQFLKNAHPPNTITS